ncbi:hypothetical protein ILYODFUR_033210 [Ilyodon furcidens]|uniref:Uncharacterized protein n=1 Tax=Ilyodon furcidens TaxID=33524 RepID=A0ABV0TNW1_9TELE
MFLGGKVSLLSFKPLNRIEHSFRPECLPKQLTSKALQQSLLFLDLPHSAPCKPVQKTPLCNKGQGLDEQTKRPFRSPPLFPTVWSNSTNFHWNVFLPCLSRES